MWFVFALGSAVFAALTSILAKIGIQGVNSTLATAIRTVVVLVMSWGMVFLTGTQGGVGDISRRSWLFLILSGLATGASWLCYYHALQIGAASKVVPVDKLSVVITLALAFVILKEPFTAKTWWAVPDHRRHPVYGAVKPPYQKCARDTPGRIFYSDSRCRVLFIRSSSGISSSLITVSICSSLSTSSSGKRLRTRSITVLR